MDVLEDEHDGLRLRERLDESAPGGERLAELRLPGTRLLHPAQREEVALDPRPLGLVGEEVSDSRSDLRNGLFGPVALEYARLSFHDLGEAPEGRSLAVRERATLPPDDELRIGVDHLEELAHETRLSDPWHADDGDELRLETRSRPSQSTDQDVQLVVPSDERRSARPRDRCRSWPEVRSRARSLAALPSLSPRQAPRLRTRSRARWRGTCTRRRGCRPAAQPTEAARPCSRRHRRRSPRRARAERRARRAPPRCSRRSEPRARASDPPRSSR